MDIVRCPSCEGYGWLEDDFSGETEDCNWCNGIGYVYRTDEGVDQQIPQADLQKSEISEQLEALEKERLRSSSFKSSSNFLSK